MQEITERLKDILASENKPCKDIDICKELGINPNTFAQMKFKNRVPYKQILEFLNKREISINLFFYGKEPTPIKKKYKILKLYNANITLGSGGINQELDSEDMIIGDLLLDYFQANKHCELIKATGDSMEPHIKDGSICIIDRSLTKIKDGKIYAINTPDGAVIKECYLKQECLMLVSYNPTYTPIYIPQEEAIVIGAIKGFMNKL